MQNLIISEKILKQADSKLSEASQWTPLLSNTEFGKDKIQ